MSCCWDCYEGLLRLSGGSSKDSPLKNHIQAELRGSGVIKANSVDIRSLMLKGDTTKSYQRYYQKLSALGQGAFGAVYKVKHKKSGALRALKEVQINSEEDSRYVLIELEAMIKLDHPNILKLYEFYESPKCLYLVTEICSGGDFGELGRGQFTQKEVRMLFRDVFAALAYCHDQGVAHRDMKFENCLIDASEKPKRAKLIDFGLAGLQKGKNNHWMKEQLGTKYWVAPEVVDASISYGVECDIWAVGVMLFILYVDEHPCAADAHTLPQKLLLRKIEKAEVRFKILDQQRIPKDLKKLVHGLLEKNPSKRITAREALQSPWIAEVDQQMLRDSLNARDSKPMSGVIDRLRQYRGYTQYEKAVLALVAHQKREQTVRDLKEVFLSLDVDKTGTLSESEIAVALKQSGITLDKREMHEIFNSLDASHDGKVHIGEWLAATIEPHSLNSEQSMDQVFDFFDLDHTGQISRQELITVLGNEKEAEEVMRQGDTSGDALISRSEFKVMMQKIADRLIAGQTSPGQTSI